MDCISAIRKRSSLQTSRKSASWPSPKGFRHVWNPPLKVHMRSDFTNQLKVFASQKPSPSDSSWIVHFPLTLFKMRRYQAIQDEYKDALRVLANLQVCCADQAFGFRLSKTLRLLLRMRLYKHRWWWIVLTLIGTLHDYMSLWHTAQYPLRSFALV